jgi:hypothetical protein
VPPLPEDLPLFVAAGPTGRIDRPQLRVCRHDAVPAWEVVDGVRVATAGETLLACARDLGLLDVVLLGDAALRSGDADGAQLDLTGAQRRRGAPLLRRASSRMNGLAESIWEGMLRVLHECCEVAVVPQHVVLDADGVFVARGDLLIVGTQRLHEYDGKVHLNREQQRADLRRARRLGAAGYERNGYVSADLLHRSVGILRDADAAIGRDHDPARIHLWHDLLRDSLFTPAGTRRLSQRLGLI